MQPPLIQSAKSVYSPSPNSSFLTLRTLHLAVNFEDGFYIGEVVIMDMETVKNSYKISASADGGPRSRVCARETLCSAPIDTSGNFPAHVSAD